MERGKEMVLIILMTFYFAVQDVRLIGDMFRRRKEKKKLPELQQPKELEREEKDA